MAGLEPLIQCTLSRIEPLAGPTDFHAQFLCEAGAASDYYGLRGSEFQIDRDIFTVVPLTSNDDIAHIDSLREASGYKIDSEAFLRAFAKSVVDMLCSGKTLYDKVTFVVLSLEQTMKLGIATRAGDCTPPPPYEGYVTLESRLSKSDYQSSDATA